MHLFPGDGAVLGLSKNLDIHLPHSAAAIAEINDHQRLIAEQGAEEAAIGSSLNVAEPLHAAPRQAVLEIEEADYPEGKGDEDGAEVADRHGQAEEQERCGKEKDRLSPIVVR